VHRLSDGSRGLAYAYDRDRRRENLVDQEAHDS
jgi:hypothetical protein